MWTAGCYDTMLLCNAPRSNYCSLKHQPVWPMYTAPHKWRRVYVMSSWHAMNLLMGRYLRCNFCFEYLFTLLTGIYKLWPTLWWLLTATCLVALLARSDLPYLFLSMPHTSQCHKDNPTPPLSTWLPDISRALLYCVQSRLFQNTIQAVFGNASFYYLRVNRGKG